MNELINNALDTDNIKCFVLTNKECPHCAEWFDTSFEMLKQEFDDVSFYVVECYEEHQSGRMPFPPLIAPTFYFYKNKKDFPLISQGILPDHEMKQSISRAIRILKDD